MTTTQARRWARLLPRGVPRYVRCYDNGGETLDRFTVCYTGNYRHNGPGSNEFEKGWFQGVAMSGSPFHPQGIGQHFENERPVDVNRWGFAPAMGRRCHLGRRIPFCALPADCRKLVLRDYLELWGLFAMQQREAR